VSTFTGRRPAAWLTVAAGSTALLLGGCAVPEPGLDVVAAEPVLDAPMRAVELGRDEVQPSSGFPVGIAVRASVDVAFSVQATPEEAVAAWQEAYSDRYSFRDESLNYPEIRGGTSEVTVSVTASDEVGKFPEPEFDEPAAGTTVVVISVAGRDPG